MNLKRPSDTPRAAEDLITFGQFSLNRRTRSLLRAGVTQKVGGRAFDILATLAQSRGQIVKTEVLLERVWPETVVEPGALRVHLVTLRKVLGARRDGTPWIENVPGEGYRLLSAVERNAPTAAPGVVVRASNDYLPVRFVSALGRSEVVSALVATLTKRRMVTLVGPGGIGKTTVAIDAARRLAVGRRDGARFIDLAALADGGLMPNAVCQALGAPMLVHDTVGSLVAFLRGSDMLLVFDSCEQVIDSAAELTHRLLSAAPNIVVLATSREALRTREEWVMRLGPLEVPPEEVQLDRNSAGGYAATALFLARAAAAAGLQAAVDDFSLLATLCRRLDGNPLAIEIAAARVGTFGMKQLLIQLDQRLSSMSSGTRSAPARHQSLSATLDWSYRTLSPVEGAILRRLSLFRSRFTVSLAAAVADFAPVRPSDVLDGIEGLVSKSLLVADSAGGAPTFRLLDMTRAYAAAKLAESGEVNIAAGRHVVAYAGLLEAAEPELTVSTPVHWNMVYGHLIEDVRSALTWAFGADGDVPEGVRLTAASGALWIQLSRSREFIPLIARALHHLEALPDRTQVEISLSLSLAQCQLRAGGPTPETFAAFERARVLAAQVGDTRSQLISLYGSLAYANVLGLNQEAVRFGERFGEVAQAADFSSAMLLYHRSMANVLFQVGRLQESQAHLQIVLDSNPESVHFFLDSQVQLEHHAASLIQQARTLWVSGRTAQALQVARKGVEVSIAFNHPITVLYTLTTAACPIAMWSGDWAAAKEYIDQLAGSSEKNSMAFWTEWAEVFSLALQWCAAPTASLEAPDWLQDAAKVASRADMLATFHPMLATDDALARAETGPDAWCTAELYRVKAERTLIRCGWENPAAQTEAEALLGKALEVARRQGARAWEARATATLERLRASQRGRLAG